jgi:hypothetical protein
VTTPHLVRPPRLAAIFADIIEPVPEPTYRGITMRSALETDFARHLDEEGIAWRYEPCRIAGYLPDFEVLGADVPTYIEVKPVLAEVPRAQERMAAIWRTHPSALLIVACAEGSRYFGAIAGGRWTSWAERWVHT